MLNHLVHDNLKVDSGFVQVTNVDRRVRVQDVLARFSLSRAQPEEGGSHTFGQYSKLCPICLHFEHLYDLECTLPILLSFGDV